MRNFCSTLGTLRTDDDDDDDDDHDNDNHYDGLHVGNLLQQCTNVCPYWAKIQLVKCRTDDDDDGR